MSTVVGYSESEQQCVTIRLHENLNNIVAWLFEFVDSASPHLTIDFVVFLGVGSGKKLTAADSEQNAPFSYRIFFSAEEREDICSNQRFLSLSLSANLLSIAFEIFRRRQSTNDINSRWQWTLCFLWFSQKNIW